MKRPATIQERKQKGQRVSTIDAHNERVAIMNRHPEHPRLTAYALHIIEQERKQRHVK